MRHVLPALLAIMVPALALAGQFEDAVLAEMNRARTQPQKYAANLKKIRGEYRGKDRVRGNVRIRTAEGAKAVDEAAAFLRRQKPLPPLRPEAGLAAAAAELAEEQSLSGKTGHEAETGPLNERVERRGSWGASLGENISYGYDDPREVVMALIVDDGVPDRGHRKNIFKGQFREAGVACATHPEFRKVCVIDFAGSFQAK